MRSEIYCRESTALGEIDETFESPPNRSEFRSCKRETCEGFPIDKAEVVAKETYNRAISQVIEMHGDYLPTESVDRIQQGVESLDVINPIEDSVNIGSFSYHGGRSYIVVCAIDERQVERTTQHEVNHFASFNREEVISYDAEGDLTHIKKVSGIHNMEYWENPKGEITSFKDLNRGFNEGITQLYTIRQLENIDPEKGIEAARQNGYLFATELAEQVEEVVGKEVMQKAYYGGDFAALKNRLESAGGVGSFDRLSRCMDTVTYSRDYSERIWAMKEAHEILASAMGGENI